MNNSSLINHNDKSKSIPKILKIPKLKKIVHSVSTKSLTSNETAANFTNSMSYINNSYSNASKFPKTYREKILSLKNKNSTIRKKFYNSSVSKNMSTKDVFAEANKILKQRKIQKYFCISETKFPKLIIKNSKDTSLNNYLINLIKDKRNEISKQEKLFDENIKEKNDLYQENYRNYLKFASNVNDSELKEKLKLNKISENLRLASDLLEKEISYNKKLKNDLEKIIHDIDKYKSCGSFLHKIFGISFPYDEINNDSNLTKRNNYELLTKKYIEIYEKENTNNFINNYLNDDNYFMEQYYFLESKIFRILRPNAINININVNVDEKDKNLINDLEDNDSLYHLKNKLKLLEMEYMNLNQAKIKLLNENNKLNKYNIKINCVDLVYEIGDILKINKTNYNKNDVREIMIYFKKISEALENKEKVVIKYIKEIENLYKNNNNKNIEILNGIIETIDKNNSIDKYRLEQKIMKEKYEKKMEEVLNNQRYVLKGRKVIFDYPIKKIKTKKVVKLKTAKSCEYDLINY